MTHKILIKGKTIEVFIGKDNHIEIYEEKNPGKTGFEFESIKQFNTFINGITDIAERYQEE